MSQKDYDYNELARMLDDEQDNLSNGHRLAEWLMKKNDYQPRRRRIFMDFVPNRLSLNIDVGEFEAPRNSGQSHNEESVIVQDDDILENTNLNQTVEQNIEDCNVSTTVRDGEVHNNTIQPSCGILQPSMKFSPNCFSTPLTRQIYTIPQASSKAKKRILRSVPTRTLLQSMDNQKENTLQQIEIKEVEQREEEVELREEVEPREGEVAQREEEDRQREEDGQQEEVEQSEEEEVEEGVQQPQNDEHQCSSSSPSVDTRLVGKSFRELMLEEQIAILPRPIETNFNNTKNKNIIESELNISSTIKSSNQAVNVNNGDKTKNNVLTLSKSPSNNNNKAEVTSSSVKKNPETINIINVSVHLTTEPNENELFENNEHIPNTQELSTQDMLVAAREMLTPTKQKEISEKPQNCEIEIVSGPKTTPLVKDKPLLKRKSPTKISEYLLTDDEKEDDQNVDVLSNSTRPLNLASSSNKPLNLDSSLTKRQKKVLLSFKSAAPLNLHKQTEKETITPYQKRSTNRLLNKAPRTPINGELFAKELKSNLERMTNNEILDLRKRNSMGGILSKKQSLQLEEKLKEELIKRRFDIEELPIILSPPAEFVGVEPEQQPQNPALVGSETLLLPVVEEPFMPPIVPPPPPSSSLLTSPIKILPLPAVLTPLNIVPPPPDFLRTTQKTPPFPVPKALSTDTIRTIVTPKTRRKLLIEETLLNNFTEELSGSEKEFCVTLQKTIRRPSSKNKKEKKVRTSKTNKRKTFINTECETPLSQQDMVEQYLDAASTVQNSRIVKSNSEISKTKRSLFNNIDNLDNVDHKNDELPTCSKNLPQPPDEFMDVVFKKPTAPPPHRANKNKKKSKLVEEKQSQQTSSGDNNNKDNNKKSPVRDLRRSQRVRAPAEAGRVEFYLRKLEEYERRSAMNKLSASRKQSTFRSTLSLQNNEKNKKNTRDSRKLKQSSNFLGDTATTSNYSNNSGLSLGGEAASSTLNSIRPLSPLLERVQEEIFPTTSKAIITPIKATTSSEKEKQIDKDNNKNIKKSKKQSKKNSKTNDIMKNNKQNKENNKKQESDKNDLQEESQQELPPIIPEIELPENRQLSVVTKTHLEFSRLNVTVPQVEFINSMIEQFKVVNDNKNNTDVTTEKEAEEIVENTNAKDTAGDDNNKINKNISMIENKRTLRVRLVRLKEQPTTSTGNKIVEKPKKKPRKKKKKNQKQKELQADDKQVAYEEQQDQNYGKKQVEEEQQGQLEVPQSSVSKNIFHEKNLELLAWLKGCNYSKPRNNNNNNNKFEELRCSAASKLSFSTLDGVDYAFYDTEEQSCIGYLRFKPLQIKNSKRAKKYHLHFVVLLGEFKISTDKDVGNFPVGDMVAVQIGARYKIENLTDETALLMVIKK